MTFPIPYVEGAPDLVTLTRNVNALIQEINLNLGDLDTRVDALEGKFTFGAYTPVLTSAGGGTVPVFTNPALTGAWLTIDDITFVNIYGNNTVGGVNGVGANQLSVSLPFPIFSLALPARVVAGSYENAGNADMSFIALSPGTSAGALLKLTVAGSNTNEAPLDCADFNNATRAISWLFFYPTG